MCHSCLGVSTALSLGVQIPLPPGKEPGEVSVFLVENGMLADGVWHPLLKDLNSGAEKDLCIRPLVVPLPVREASGGFDDGTMA